MNHKFIFLLVLVAAIVGCGEEPLRPSMTDLSFPAKDRKITLYANDGKVITVWEGHYALFIKDSTRVLKIGKRETIISEGILVAEDR
ncbi:MAG: hypothetical protein AAB706_03780 [Patescibacteria group bacterium]